eukprot:CAMPEP_0206371814 /NCGR_PEP_ID=MMETSP0294-20121207/6716_1 /ASSEMBLY_ACC=CAM_ASM_000327 /TAXON_ID=39354 /ORGANISM="Heterosigma akashiwo, Strain CCMP2393" /LENGTH=92 /DNA_ID=CAMNT_0053819031 /DNA_START=675 /DNA_END=950 /DNA_ORIENTATION=+
MPHSAQVGLFSSSCSKSLDVSGSFASTAAAAVLPAAADPLEAPPAAADGGDPAHHLVLILRLQFQAVPVVVDHEEAEGHPPGAGDGGAVAHV